MVDIEFIKNAAKAKRMTLGELAERIGYSEPGFHRACVNRNFKLDALEKIGLVLQITPESYIKDQRLLTIIQALNSGKIEDVGHQSRETISQIVEGERKHFEDEITHYRKQLDVKDKQIEYLMNQLEQKDSLIRTSMNYLRGMGVELLDNQDNSKGADPK